MSYKGYNGIEKYPFVVKKQEDTTIEYNVSVQKGSLVIKFVNGNDIIFEEVFTSDDQGSFSFVPNSSAQFITIIGNFTKGGCDFKIIRHASSDDGLKEV